MYLINGTSALDLDINEKSSNSTDLLNNHFEERILPIRGIIGECLGNNLNEAQGTFFYSRLNPIGVLRATNGRFSIKGDEYNNTKGSIVWSLPLSNLDNIIPPKDLAELEVLKIDNLRLRKLVTELNLKSYSLQEENYALKLELKEINGKIKSLEERLLEMFDIYKAQPFKGLFTSTFTCFFLSIVLLMSSWTLLGAVMGFAFLTLLFLSTYTLWRVKEIALITPRLMVIGFIGSLGLLVTGILSLFVS